MLRAKNNASLHHDNQGGKSAKILFHIFHSLLAMKNTVTSTCVLTARVLAVKISEVQFFFFYFNEQECHDDSHI